MVFRETLKNFFILCQFSLCVSVIIFRYLTKELISTLLAITVVLLLILLTKQFVFFLGKAVVGDYSINFALRIILLQIPNLLTLILPLSLFLSILLVYGRMYVDNEMVVLSACGFSQRQLLLFTASFALVVTIIIGVFTLWLNPRVAFTLDKLSGQAKSVSLVKMLFPERFRAFSKGKDVYYVESVSRDRQQVRGVFIAQQIERKVNQETKTEGTEGTEGETSLNSDQTKWRILTARKGYFEESAKDSVDGSSDQFLVLTDGFRYDGIPGQRDYQVIKFGELRVRLNKNVSAIKQKKESMTLLDLWRRRNEDKFLMAELHWRFVFPISTFLLAIFAVSMSRVKPRQGKYAQLFPSMLFYIIYANLLIVGRTWIEQGRVSPAIGLWWAYGVCVLSIILVSYRQYFSVWLIRRLPKKTF